MTLDLPALRKLLDSKPAFDSELSNVLMVNANTLIRAAEERDELLAACDAKDSLLACYRLGTRPSEALLRRLDRANEALRRAKEPR